MIDKARVISSSGERKSSVRGTKVGDEAAPGRAEKGELDA
jgi:hypothetical protein